MFVSIYPLSAILDSTVLLRLHAKSILDTILPIAFVLGTIWPPLHSFTMLHQLSLYFGCVAYIHLLLASFATFMCFIQVSELKDLMLLVVRSSRISASFRLVKTKLCSTMCWCILFRLESDLLLLLGVLGAAFSVTH